MERLNASESAEVVMVRRGDQPWATVRSQALRSRSTSAEDVMWRELRDRRLGGYKFVRQKAVGAYFPDFLCREFRVVVEIDGETHSTDVELAEDAARTAYLEANGYRVLRVWNGEVRENLDGVLRTIAMALDEISGRGPEGGRV